MFGTAVPFRFSKIDRNRCRPHRPPEQAFLAPTFTRPLQSEKPNRNEIKPFIIKYLTVFYSPPKWPRP
jgi:hypothetical protein